MQGRLWALTQQNQSSCTFCVRVVWWQWTLLRHTHCFYQLRQPAAVHSQEDRHREMLLLEETREGT